MTSRDFFVADDWLAAQGKETRVTIARCLARIQQLALSKAYAAWVFHTSEKLRLKRVLEKTIIRIVKVRQVFPNLYA